MRKKKVLVIASGTYISGAEVMTLHILEGLKSEFEIFCVTNGWTNGDFQERLSLLNIAFDSVKLGWLYLSNLKWTLDSIVHYPRAFFKFRRIIRDYKPDVIYSISFRPIILLYPLFKNDSIILHIHDTNSTSKQSKFFLQWCQKKIRKFIAISHFIQNDLLKCKLDEFKIEMIYNGIKILDELPVTAKKYFTIGIVGQVIERKGHLIAIKALHLLIKEGYKVSLIIVGKGDSHYESILKNTIESYGINEFVEWRGFIKKVEDVYKGIDVIVAPTQNEEPFGLMACEANMFGIPAIVSNKGGLAEIITDGFNGFLFNSENSTELADKIKKYIDNENLLVEAKRRSREIVVQKFSASAMQLKLINIINIV